MDLSLDSFNPMDDDDGTDSDSGGGGRYGAEDQAANPFLGGGDDEEDAVTISGAGYDDKSMEKEAAMQADSGSNPFLDDDEDAAAAPVGQHTPPARAFSKLNSVAEGAPLAPSMGGIHFGRREEQPLVGAGASAAAPHKAGGFQFGVTAGGGAAAGGGDGARYGAAKDGVQFGAGAPSPPPLPARAAAATVWPAASPGKPSHITGIKIATPTGSTPRVGGFNIGVPRPAAGADGANGTAGLGTKLASKGGVTFGVPPGERATPTQQHA
eukprot:SAG22_NODE_5131_length_1080_cov_1.177370_1_plen_267_part_01